METMFVVSDGIARKVSGNVEIQNHMFTGINEFGLNDKNRVIFMADQKQQKYDMPEHLFGDVLERRDRIMKAHLARKKMTAVLLSGNKGSGKTFLMKACINDALDRGIPVINFNSVIGGSPDEQINLISKDNGNLVLVIDEFEKVFHRDEWQKRLLTFLDGTFNGRILVLISVNDIKNMDDNFFNRPGRILYHWQYGPLEHSVIKEVVSKNLDNKTLVDETIARLSAIREVNFDIISSVVNEMNLHEINVEEALKPLNVDKTVRTGF